MNLDHLTKAKPNGTSFTTCASSKLSRNYYPSLLYPCISFFLSDIVSKFHFISLRVEIIRKKKSSEKFLLSLLPIEELFLIYSYYIFIYFVLCVEHLPVLFHLFLISQTYNPKASCELNGSLEFFFI